MYGNISTLQQTSNGIQTQVSNLQGQVSQVQQSAAGIMSTVRNLEGQYSRMAQTVNGWTFTTINGTTYIDGSKIYTGTLTADAIRVSGSNYGSLSNTMYYSDYGNSLNLVAYGGNTLRMSAQEVSLQGSQITMTGIANFGNAVYMEDAPEVRLPHNSDVWVGTSQGPKTLYQFVRMVIDGA